MSAAVTDQDPADRSAPDVSDTGGGRPGQLLPVASIAGRALIIVIAIMTFLASLTVGTVELIASASSSWQGEIAREVTIQVRPRPGRDVEADVRRAADLARGTTGVIEARSLARGESERLLEPWLGAGLDLADLPVPRLIVVKLADTRPDLAALRTRLAAEVPVATLDDHRLWLSRLGAMANAMVVVGLAILVLVLTATGLAVAFATRGAMAGNRSIIEVLHLVGASDMFIAREFQRHFLRLGLRGGAIGGGAAVVFFGLAGLLAGYWRATPGGDQVEALFGSFGLGAGGYLAIGGIALVVALTTAIVSRLTVYRNLRGLD